MRTLSRSFIFAISTLLFQVGIAHAYPQTIRLNYVSCTGCHTSPQGGGTLTEYGKGFGDSSSFWIREYETPTNSFYKAITLGEKLQHQLQTRYLFLRQRSGLTTMSDDFLMQLDYLGSYALSEKFRFDLTVGYVPERVRAPGRAAPRGALGEEFVLRKSILAYRSTEEDEWSIGRDFLPGGITTDDHTSLLKSQSRRNVTDFFTQVRWDHFSKDWLWTPYAFGPSFEENPGNQEWGGGFRLEKALTENKTVGFVAQFGQSEALTRSMNSLFSRIGLGERVSLLAEIQFSPRSKRSTQEHFAQFLTYVRAGVNPTEWLECAGVVETLNREVPAAARSKQFGPSFHFRILREVSLMVDGRWLEQQGVTSSAWALQIFGRL